MTDKEYEKHYKYQEDFAWILDEFEDWCELCRHLPEYEYSWFNSEVGWC